MTHPTPHLSLDLETMGTAPDSAIVAIGAVFFNEHTGQMGAEFYRTVHLATSVRLGFKMDPGTVLWWLGQSDEARNAIRFNAVTAEDAFVDFVDWVAEHGPAKPDLRVFAASPAFDCMKVEAHLKALDLPVPWFYWAERDYRTIRERNKNVSEAERVGHHNALGDAKHQAQHLIRIRQHHVNKAA